MVFFFEMYMLDTFLGFTRQQIKMLNEKYNIVLSLFGRKRRKQRLGGLHSLPPPYCIRAQLDDDVTSLTPAGSGGWGPPPQSL